MDNEGQVVTVVPIDSRIYNSRLNGLSPTCYLPTDAIVWDDSGGDTFCQRCGGCGCFTAYCVSICNDKY